MPGHDHSADARSASTRATNQITNLGEEVLLLRQRLDRLAMVNKAMWALLRDKVGLTDVELRSMMLELEAADGRSPNQKQVCSGCGRALMAKLGRCQYCNAETTPTDLFSI